MPDWNASVELISTGVADPRSWSLMHQLSCQSSGMNASSCARVDERRTTASFSYTGTPDWCPVWIGPWLHPLAVPLPLVSKTLPVESSTTTPPAAQKPAP